MSWNINQVALSGRLTRDPELRELANDNRVVSFGIAVNKGKDQNGNEKVVFVDIEAWGVTASIVAEKASKGSLVFVSGELKSDSWEGPDGSKRSKLLVTARNVEVGRGVSDE